MSLKPQVESYTLVNASSTVTSAYNIYHIDATDDDITLTLPAAASTVRGKTYRFLRLDNSANTVTITRAGSDTIGSGLTSVTLAPGGGFEIINYSSSSWIQINFGYSENSIVTNPVADGGTLVYASNIYNTIDATADAVDVTMPAMANVPMNAVVKVCRLDNVGGNTVTLTVDNTGTETILTNTSAATTATVPVTKTVSLVKTSSTQWTLLYL